MSILIENLIKNFGFNIILDYVNLEIKLGKLIVLLGLLGFGKLIFLCFIVGLENLNSGSIWLIGKNVVFLSI